MTQIKVEHGEEENRETERRRRASVQNGTSICLKQQPGVPLTKDNLGLVDASFKFCPRKQGVDDPDGSNPVWMAFMYIKTNDIIRLMLNGFYWSKANVKPAQGSFGYNFENRTPSPSQYNLFRRYSLADTSGALLWTAWLVVFSRQNSVAFLRSFPIADVIDAQITEASALNKRREWIYEYALDHPLQSYNAIFGPLKLLGWPMHVY